MPEKLSDLKAADYNPRTIDEVSLEGLKYSLDEFGDISGIVFNSRTGQLVAGHQRVKALQQYFGDLQIINDSIVTPNGATFQIRIVDWPLEKEKAANVAANNPHIQGEFTSELGLILEEIQISLPDISEKVRLSEIEIPQISLNDGENPLDTNEISYKPQFGVIIICENEEEQQKVFEKLQIEGYNLRVVTT